MKEQAGASIEDLIPSGQGGQQQGVVKGLGQLLGAGQSGTSVPAEPDTPQTKMSTKKKSKKKQAEAVVRTDPQLLPNQRMQNLLGSFQ